MEISNTIAKYILCNNKTEYSVTDAVKNALGRKENHVEVTLDSVGHVNQA